MTRKDPATPLVRPARLSDAPKLARARYAFRVEISGATEPERAFVERCTRWMRERLAAPRSAWSAWVAVTGDEVLGMVWVQFLEKLPNPVGEPESHAYLTNFYVVAAKRGKGLGAALLTAALAECDARGVDAVILWPTAGSRPLYERHGFSVRDDLFERR